MRYFSSKATIRTTICRFSFMFSSPISSPIDLVLQPLWIIQSLNMIAIFLSPCFELRYIPISMHQLWDTYLSVIFLLVWLYILTKGRLKIHTVSLVFQYGKTGAECTTSVWAQPVLLMLLPWLEWVTLNLTAPHERLYFKAQLTRSPLISCKDWSLTPAWPQSILLILFHSLMSIIVMGGHACIPIRTVSFLMGVKRKCWLLTHFGIFRAECVVPCT